jgi:hypothetical protein
MSLSNYTETALCNWLRGSANMPAAASPFLGLFSVSPGETGSSGTEVTTLIRPAGRLAISFGAPTDGVIANTVAIDFGVSANDTSITHFGIYDAASGGNLIAYGALNSPRTILTADEVNWSAGSLIITVN